MEGSGQSQCHERCIVTSNVVKNGLYLVDEKKSQKFTKQKIFFEVLDFEVDFSKY